MAVTRIDRCPTCGGTRFSAHCTSPLCTWVRCDYCRAFGTVDASRWATAKAA